MRSPHPLLAAANRNLVAIHSGTYRNRASAAQERREAERQRSLRLREIEKAERARIRELKAELKDLTKLCNQFDRDLQKGKLSSEDRGAYEEVDHRREQLLEELHGPF
jgi:uncharacterized protein YlxW (UPF0749 family)